MMTQLDERERNSDAALQSTDKELNLKQQALEMHKRKVTVACTCIRHVHVHEN